MACYVFIIAFCGERGQVYILPVIIIIHFFHEQVPQRATRNRRTSRFQPHDDVPYENIDGNSSTIDFDFFMKFMESRQLIMSYKRNNSMFCDIHSA